MTIHDCTKLLVPLAVTLGVELDEPDFRAYHVALDDVPLPLLAAACQRATRVQRDRFEPRFPTASKLREWAEEARQRALQAQPWAPCEQCADSPRWVSFTDDQGHGRVKPCPCVLAYRTRVQQAGLGHQLALPAAEEVEA